MEWSQMLQTVAAAFGGGLLTFGLGLYNAKPKKNSIEIENMKTAMGKLQEVINQLMQTNEARTKDSENYRKETNQTIKELKQEINDMKIRLDIKHEAIYAAEHCDKIDDTSECIVIKTFKERCKECLNKD